MSLELLVQTLDADSDGLEVAEANQIAGTSTAAEDADLDGDGKLDPAGFEVATGGEPVYLTMDSSLVRAQGFVELDIFGSVILTGSVAFELGPMQDVVLTDGSPRHVTTMTIGGLDICAFVGYQGPYWTDLDQDHLVSWALPALTDGDDADEFVDVLTFDGVAYGDKDYDGIVDPGETADPDLARWTLPRLTDGSVVTFEGVQYGDLNGNGLVDRGETAELSEDAVGLHITDLDIGLVLMASVSLDPEDIGVYLAADARIQSFGFVGLDDFIEINGELFLQLNVGVGLSFASLLDFSPVDFIASFPDPDGDGPEQAGFKVNTGPDSPPVLLDFDRFLIDIQLSGSIRAVNFFELTGAFLFQADEQGLKVFVNASLAIGPAGDFFDRDALGVLIINDQGLAADVDVSLTIGSALVGVSKDTSDGSGAVIQARLIMNTSGLTQQVRIPDQFLDDLSPEALARLVQDGDGWYYQVQGTAPSLSSLFKDVNLPDTPLDSGEAAGYLAIVFSAKLVIQEAFVLDGKFGILATSSSFELRIGGMVALGPFGQMAASGLLLIDSQGVIGRVILDYDFGQSALGGAGIGVKITGDFLLEVNTGAERSVEVFDFSEGGLVTRLVTISPGVLVRAQGTADFIGFLEASADLKIEIRSNMFYLGGSVTIDLGSLISTQVSLDVLVTDDGFYLAADASVNANIASIIKIDASGVLVINTMSDSVFIGQTGRWYAANSFLLDLSGNVSILGVLNFDAGFKVQVGGGTFTHAAGAAKAAPPMEADAFLHPGQWAVSFRAGMSFFGLATLNADGWFNHAARFAIHLDGRLAIPSESTGLAGGFSIDVWMTSGPSGQFGIAGEGYVRVKVFGVTLTGVNVEFDFIADRPTTSNASFIEVRISVTVSFKILFVKVSKTASFTIGRLEIPPEPVLGVVEDAVLTLNMGSEARRTTRCVGRDMTDEMFIVEHVSGDADAGETVRVTGVGYTQVFTGVKKIVAYGDDGNDVIVLRPNLAGQRVLVPVEFYGEDGEECTDLRRSRFDRADHPGRRQRERLP